MARDSREYRKGFRVVADCHRPAYAAMRECLGASMSPADAEACEEVYDDEIRPCAELDEHVAMRDEILASRCGFCEPEATMGPAAELQDGFVYCIDEFQDD